MFIPSKINSIDEEKVYREIQVHNRKALWAGKERQDTRKELKEGGVSQDLALSIPLKINSINEEKVYTEIQEKNRKELWKMRDAFL